MSIQPIGSVDALGNVSATEALLVEYLHQHHASPAQIALAESQAKAEKTLEERAADGDQIAIYHLEVEAEQSVLLPPLPPTDLHPNHPAGPHEAGVGDVVDLYD